MLRGTSLHAHYEWYQCRLSPRVCAPSTQSARRCAAQPARHARRCAAPRLEGRAVLPALGQQLPGVVGAASDGNYQLDDADKVCGSAPMPPPPPPPALQPAAVHHILHCIKPQLYVACPLCYPCRMPPVLCVACSLNCAWDATSICAPHATSVARNAACVHASCSFRTLLCCHKPLPMPMLPGQAQWNSPPSQHHHTSFTHTPPHTPGAPATPQQALVRRLLDTPLPQLMAEAAALRDQGHGNVVTFSPKACTSLL